MNSDNYKKAFSNIRPSDERLERIFDMTEKKKRVRGFKKGLIAVIAVIIVLMCGMLTANAATDGAFFDGVKLIINGEEVDVANYLKVHKSYTKDDGEIVDEYTFALPEGEGSVSIERSAEENLSEGDNSFSIGFETEEGSASVVEFESDGEASDSEN